MTAFGPYEFWGGKRCLERGIEKEEEINQKDPYQYTFGGLGRRTPGRLEGKKGGSRG